MHSRRGKGWRDGGSLTTAETATVHRIENVYFPPKCTLAARHLRVRSFREENDRFFNIALAMNNYWAACMPETLSCNECMLKLRRRRTVRLTRLPNALQIELFRNNEHKL